MHTGLLMSSDELTLLMKRLFLSLAIFLDLQSYYFWHYALLNLLLVCTVYFHSCIFSLPIYYVQSTCFCRHFASCIYSDKSASCWSTWCIYVHVIIDRFGISLFFTFYSFQLSVFCSFLLSFLWDYFLVFNFRF